MPKAIESKPLVEAKKNGWPLYWVYTCRGGYCEFLLRAETCTYENGATRSKLIWKTHYLTDANQMHEHLAATCKTYCVSSWKKVEEVHWLNSGEKMSYLNPREDL